jgi:hypothetical protein
MFKVLNLFWVLERVECIGFFWDRRNQYSITSIILPQHLLKIQESIVNWAYMNITNPYGMESQWCFTLNASSSVLSSPI